MTSQTPSPHPKTLRERRDGEVCSAGRRWCSSISDRGFAQEGLVEHPENAGAIYSHRLPRPSFPWLASARRLPPVVELVLAHRDRQRCPEAAESQGFGIARGQILIGLLKGLRVVTAPIFAKISA